MRPALLAAALLFACAHAQVAPGGRSVVDVFSEKITLTFYGFGTPGCGDFFPPGSSVTYEPPGTRLSGDIITVPAATFAINGTACDAAPAAELTIGEQPVGLFAFMKQQYTDDSLLFYFYGHSAGNGTEPQCVPSASGGVGAEVELGAFAMYEASKRTELLTPDPREGKMVTEPLVRYAVIDMNVRGFGQLGCVFSDEGAADVKVAGSKTGDGGSKTGDGGSKTGDGGSGGDRDSVGRKRRLGAGPIAGICVATAAVVALFAALLAFAHFRRREAGRVPVEAADGVERGEGESADSGADQRVVQ
jgi:hypothetical protein